MGEGEDRGTNKCLVRQLLCLYPFPQCSQRSSGRLNLRPPSFAWGWPSLALRTRSFCKASSPSSGDAFSWSSMALSWCSGLTSAFMNLCAGMLAGGETMPPAPDLDIRRAPMVIGTDVTLLFMSPIAAAAAAAATMFALLFVTLLRRATR